MLDTTTPGTPVTAPPIAPDPAPLRKRGHGLLWTALAVLVAAGAGGGGWWWHAHQPPPQAQAQPPIKVPVMTAAPRTVPIYRSFPATTEAMRAVPIQARVTGYLVEQGAADGTDVAVGALLYRVDASDYQAALAQAVGQRDRSTASLSYSKVSKGRNETLARDGWASRDTFDQADSTNRQNEAGLATDSAARRAAALNLCARRSAPRSPDGSAAARCSRAA